jgi:hypothetical protein
MLNEDSHAAPPTESTLKIDSTAERNIFVAD